MTHLNVWRALSKDRIPKEFDLRLDDRVREGESIK